MKKYSALADIIKSSTSSVKKKTGVSIGFHDPDTWVSTGNYALNYRISGDFEKGIPLGKVIMFAGESGCLPETAYVDVQYKHNKKSVSIHDLKNMFNESASDLKIRTPFGYQRITKWIDKGLMKMIKISTKSLSTECSKNHLLLNSDNEWLTAEQFKIGNKVKTVNGIETITEIEDISDAVCYDFTVEHESHSYYGDGFVSHNSGKSFITSGNLAREAQKQGIFVVLVDTENALDEAWLHALGVDTAEDKLLKVNMAMIGDLAKFTYDFIEGYRKETEGTKKEDLQKVLFIVDSLGMLNTEVANDQMKDGNLKGDLGHKPKQLKAYITNCVNSLGALNIGMVLTNHSYASQNMYDPDPKISGGSGMVYAASIVIAMTKLKLKEDEDGNKTTSVNGIRSKCKVMKTRYAKPFEEVEIRIPYNTGMNPRSGLLEMFEAYDLITKSGNRLQYIDYETGEVIVKYRKDWMKNSDGCIDLVMKQFKQHPYIKQLEEQVSYDDISDSDEVEDEDGTGEIE